MHGHMKLKKDIQLIAHIHNKIYAIFMEGSLKIQLKVLRIYKCCKFSNNTLSTISEPEEATH
jgi:hypothetical protein